MFQSCLCFIHKFSFKFFQNEPGVSRKKLIETALENCEVYRYEYILNKPTQNLESMLEMALDELLIQNMIKTAQASCNLST